MGFYIVKIVITTALIVVISEIGKRSSLIGATLASIPLVSVLGIFWLYLETRDTARVSGLAGNVFWLTLPSLILFISLPLLLRWGLSFYPSIAISITATIICYFIMVALLHYHGIRL